MSEAYPLHWPVGWPRTKHPSVSRFDVSMADARDGLFAEIARMGGSYPVLSTNLELRLDGLPRAQQREPADAGVAVYFMRKGKQMVFACDRWNRTKDNMRAIAKTIEAMRGIERWGASDMLERAFSAFEALPAPGASPRRNWWDVLGVERSAASETIKSAYRKRAAEVHPDRPGGSASAMAELNVARDAALSASAS